MEAANYGILSLIPLALTLLLAFWKKDAVFALFMGCLSGVLLLGHSLSFPICARISRIRRFAFWIFRFSAPFSVAIPFFSIWQAATPMWTVGISSIPLSALLRWSMRSGLPARSR